MLTEADREWVKAIVQAAIERAVFVTQERCAERMAEHVRECPNMRHMKMLIVGAVIGVVLVTTNGVISLASTIAPLLMGM